MIIKVLIVVVLLMNCSTYHLVYARKSSPLMKLTKLAAQATTTAWPQDGFDGMHTSRVPYTVDHSDFATNISVPFIQDNSFNYQPAIFHTGLQKLILPIGQRVGQFIALTGFYLVDVKTGKAEKTALQLEPKYSLVNNLLLDSKGILYAVVFSIENYGSGNSLIKVNTYDWSSFTVTHFTPAYQQVGSIISDDNSCLVFLAPKWLGCLRLDNPSIAKWNITIPEEPYGASQMLLAREKNQDYVYVSLMHNILKVSVSSGKLVRAVNLGRYFLSSINHMGVDGFISFSYETNGAPTYFGVMHVDSGNYNSIEHFGLVGENYIVSQTYLDHSLLSSYVFKTVVFSSEARTTVREIHVYTTLVHVSSDSSVKISKPFAFFGTDLKTRYEVPRASITKDNSKLVYYTNGSYSVFDISSGKVEKVVPSKWNFGYAHLITGDNGRVYSLVQNANLGLESYKLQ